MSVREHFKSIYGGRSSNITEVRKSMDASGYERIDMPKGLSVARMVKWCMEHIGYDNFVICQNYIYFGSVGDLVKFKLMCNPSELMPKRRI